MSSSLRKKQKVSHVADDAGLGGLYDFLPAPDPEKDAHAKISATKISRPKLPPEDKTKVIFLDVDGVILPSGSVETIILDGVALPVRDKIKESDFPAASMGHLRNIIQQTGAMVILSSEWRRTEELRSSIQAVLKVHDIPAFREWTPIFQPKAEIQKENAIVAWCERRAREIGHWLKEHKEVKDWVILDDLDFSWADRVRAAGTPWCKYRSVHTNDRHCITPEDAAKAVQILTHPPPEPKMKRKTSGNSEVQSEPVFCSTEESGPDRIRLG